MTCKHVIRYDAMGRNRYCIRVPQCGYREDLYMTAEHERGLHDREVRGCYPCERNARQEARDRVRAIENGEVE